MLCSNLFFTSHVVNLVSSSRIYEENLDVELFYAQISDVLFEVTFFNIHYVLPVVHIIYANILLRLTILGDR